MNTGSKKRLIQWYSVTAGATDGIGGFEDPTTDPVTKWARIRETSEAFKFYSGFQAYDKVLQVDINYLSAKDIKEKDYFLIDSVRYNISSIQNIDDKERTIRFIVNKVTGNAE